jgi:hypothetical protein
VTTGDNIDLPIEGIKSINAIVVIRILPIVKWKNITCIVPLIIVYSYHYIRHRIYLVEEVEIHAEKGDFI